MPRVLEWPKRRSRVCLQIPSEIFGCVVSWQNSAEAFRLLVPMAKALLSQIALARKHVRGKPFNSFATEQAVELDSLEATVHTATAVAAAKLRHTTVRQRTVSLQGMPWTKHA